MDVSATAAKASMKEQMLENIFNDAKFEIRHKGKSMHFVLGQTFKSNCKITDNMLHIKKYNPMKTIRQFKKNKPINYLVPLNLRLQKYIDIRIAN